VLSFEHTVMNEHGLHTRPAADFVKACKGYEAKISVTNKGRSGSGKSLMKVVSLGICHGDTITVEIEGSDAPQVHAELPRFLAELKG